MKTPRISRRKHNEICNDFATKAGKKTKKAILEEHGVKQYDFSKANDYYKRFDYVQSEVKKGKTAYEAQLSYYSGD